MREKNYRLLATDYWLLPVIIRRFGFVVLVLLLLAPRAWAKDSPRLAPDLSRYEGRTIESVDVERSEEHTSELQSRQYLVCRLLLEKKKKNKNTKTHDNAQ